MVPAKLPNKVPNGVSVARLRGKTLVSEKTIIKWMKNPRSVRPSVALHLAAAAGELGIGVPVTRVVKPWDSEGDTQELLASKPVTPVEAGDGDARSLFDLTPNAPGRRWLPLGDVEEGVEVFAAYERDSGDCGQPWSRVRVVGPKPEAP